MANNGCGCNDSVLLTSQSQQAGSANIEIIGNPPIYVQKQNFATKSVFTISYNEAVALAGALSITNVVTNPAGAAYLSGVVPLKGVEVTDVSLGWTLTKSGLAAQVALQTLDAVQIDNALRAFTYNGISLFSTSDLADRTFDLVADDGLGNPGSSVSLSTILSFGNKIYYGEGALIENDDNALITLLQSLDFSIQKNDNISFEPQSLSPFVYTYFAIPTDLGIPTFLDVNSPITVDPMRILKSSFAMSNGIQSETYTVYVSKQGALRGADIQSQ